MTATRGKLILYYRIKWIINEATEQAFGLRDAVKQDFHVHREEMFVVTKAVMEEEEKLVRTQCGKLLCHLVAEITLLANKGHSCVPAGASRRSLQDWNSSEIIPAPPLPQAVCAISPPGVYFMCTRAKNLLVPIVVQNNFPPSSSVKGWFKTIQTLSEMLLTLEGKGAHGAAGEGGRFWTCFYSFPGPLLRHLSSSVPSSMPCSAAPVYMHINLAS